MTADTSDFHADCDRLTSWLKSMPAKELARAIDAAPRTVESWRNGYTQPSMDHLKKLAALWGKDFVLDIFGPSFPTDEDALRQIAVARHALDTLARRLESDINDHAKALDRRHAGKDRGKVRGLGRAVSAVGKSTAVIALACVVTLASLHADKRPDARTYRGPARREEVSL